jgi:hypothetical protein
VLAFQEFDDGSGPGLYVGGNFGTVGELAANRIARWDGAWSTVGSGMNDDVDALTVFDDGTSPALFAGGEFTERLPARHHHGDLHRHGRRRQPGDVLLHGRRVARAARTGALKRRPFSARAAGSGRRLARIPREDPGKVGPPSGAYAVR